MNLFKRSKAVQVKNEERDLKDIATEYWQGRIDPRPRIPLRDFNRLINSARNFLEKDKKGALKMGIFSVETNKYDPYWVKGELIENFVWEMYKISACVQGKTIVLATNEINEITHSFYTAEEFKKILPKIGVHSKIGYSSFSARYGIEFRTNSRVVGFDRRLEFSNWYKDEEILMWMYNEKSPLMDEFVKELRKLKDLVEREKEKEQTKREQEEAREEENYQQYCELLKMEI